MHPSPPSRQAKMPTIGFSPPLFPLDFVPLVERTYGKCSPPPLGALPQWLHEKASAPLLPTPLFPDGHIRHLESAPPPAKNFGAADNLPPSPNPPLHHHPPHALNRYLGVLESTLLQLNLQRRRYRTQAATPPLPLPFDTPPETSGSE